MKKLFTLILFACSLGSSHAQLISKHANWKYLDNGSNQGIAWRDSIFNDSNWSSGNAQLGYGDGDENTVISYGSNSSNKHICYYFRKQFTVSNPQLYNGLEIKILRDDGAVIYINGQEVIRSNMPAGNISYNTLAASTVSGNNENNYYSYNISSSYLVSGQNTIAVEVHQRSITSSDLSFDFWMDFKALTVFRKNPYLLYPGENDKMLLVWQMHNTDTCHIYLGTNTLYTDTITSVEYGNDHLHKYLFTNLSQATKYFYKVSVNSNDYKTGSFITGLSNNAKNVSFYAYGDTRTYPLLHDSVAKQVLNAISMDSASQSFIISSGDIVANGNQESDWDEQFFSPQYTHINEMIAKLPYLVSIGNHGGQGQLFSKYFPIPMFNNNRFYYSFDYGPVHITVIDQYTNISPSSQQFQWLENDLSASAKKWKILLLHKPGWSAGGGHSNSSLVQNYIQPLCVKYGVQFVIGGHNHYYARAVVGGVQHITTGGGGAPLYNPNPNASNIVTVDKSLHFCKISIVDDSLFFKAIRADGSIIESLSFDISTTAILDTRKTNSNYYKVYAYDKTINITNLSKHKASVEIYNNMGQLIRKEQIETDISIKMKRKGVYFVRVYNNQNQFVYKVIID
jgi:hypothetical protein